MTEERSAAVRRTPFEIAFVEGGHEDGLLPAIAQEAESRGVDVTLPERMLLLEGAGELLRRLRPEDDASATGSGEYGALVFHGFHFWRSGRPLFVLEPGAARALLSAPPSVGAWTLDAPAAAGYLQLPRHLVWVPGDEDAAEAVDGFFWTLSAAPDGARRLLLALVLGLRPDRPGFGVISIDAPLPAPPSAHWADVRGRESGDDFANILPGGEIEGLFALTSVAEALRLASLAFHLAASPAGAPGEAETPASPEPSAAAPSSHALPPTALPYRRIPGAPHG